MGRAPLPPLPPLGFAVTRVHLCASPPFFLADGKPGRTHVLVPAVGCKFGLAWSDGPRRFSGSKAPQWAETCSSCLSDPQVKDEDKSLAVKRPVKEDGAVSVTGQRAGWSFWGWGLSLVGTAPVTGPEDAMQGHGLSDALSTEFYSHAGCLRVEWSLFVGQGGHH